MCTQLNRSALMRGAFLLLLIVALSLPAWCIVGYVRVEATDQDGSTVEDVQVFVDGESVGETRDGTLIVEVSPGTRNIEARKEGYQSQLRSVEVRDEELTVVRFEFVRSRIRAEGLAREERTTVGQQTGSIVVRSVPVGDLPVSLDGVELGETDLRLTGVGTGPHRLSVQTGNSEITTRFVLDPGQERIFQANLIRGEFIELVTIVFDLNPRTAELTIDGQPYDDREVVVRRGQAYEVSVTAAGYVTSSESVTFEEAGEHAVGLVSDRPAPSGRTGLRSTDWQELLTHMQLQAFREPVPAEDFELTTTRGRDVALSEYEGRYVLLNFWASWCPPCRNEMPSLQYLHESMDRSGLAVVTVNMREEADLVTDYCDDNDLNFPVLLDLSGRVSSQYGVRSIPTTFIIDPEGHVLGMRVGYLNWSDQSVLEALEVLVSGR